MKGTRKELKYVSRTGNNLFSGSLMAKAVRQMTNCRCRVVITADGFFRGTKSVHLKPIVDRAAEIAEQEGVKVNFDGLLPEETKVTHCTTG